LPELTVPRDVLRGRTDVYPTRWVSKTTGKAGYAPACANEWRAGVAKSASSCPNHSFISLLHRGSGSVLRPWISRC